MCAYAWQPVHVAVRAEGSGSTLSVTLRICSRKLMAFGRLATSVEWWTGPLAGNDAAFAPVVGQLCAAGLACCGGSPWTVVGPSRSSSCAPPLSQRSSTSRRFATWCSWRFRGLQKACKSRPFPAGASRTASPPGQSQRRARGLRPSWMQLRCQKECCSSGG
eukprot:s2696_g8.t1